ncbi:hypothetical protein K458DRAFT_438552 [Lentithecium fluviatile CBS 122367]|uniref:Xylanolytic transcriptional activator regulatory domain-containing protein n=1 Tax=Lentithecium fluviatile CBS 122367 TaxID=1168545 RepID=A0A6G1JJK5_9PLEO|nr:hypothetical protein K458DRAFT_438552 [Lentithecium fluviatile CBS 122367]
MNPTMAEDIAVLEQYLTSQAPEGRAATKPYSTISNAPGNPIIYLAVPRRRKGLKSAIDPGRTQREVVEQVLSPFTSEVRKLYFDHLHPCFPILDEKTFSEMWNKDDDRISSSLICDLYASALLFWNKSDVLRHHPRPDMQFIWNQAVAALQDDFMAPTISTVHAALLDMVGRPVMQVTGNIVNAGRVVTLAHSLGLHRDPTHWKATEHEKNVRIRLWWGVLIHDYWSSIGHGIPPSINRRCYDVPLPSLDSLLTANAAQGTRQAATSFLHLCKLSQILGGALPFVYSLQLDVDEIWRNLRKLECALDDWVEGLPQFLRMSQATISGVDGSSNLWFCYLSVKVLICRLAFKAILKDPKQTASEARQYRLAMLREAACEITDFITSLTEPQLHEFWMPYISYLLVSAATVLLRCTVECGDLITKRSCTARLVRFRDRLKQARRENEWDLADFCLERCHDPIQKIADALGITSPIAQPPVTSPASGTIPNTQVSSPPGQFDAMPEFSSTMPDVFLPIDSLDFPWETMWDSFDGPWPIQI